MVGVALLVHRGDDLLEEEHQENGREHSDTDNTKARYCLELLKEGPLSILNCFLNRLGVSIVKNQNQLLGSTVIKKLHDMTFFQVSTVSILDFSNVIIDESNIYTNPVSLVFPNFGNLLAGCIIKFQGVRRVRMDSFNQSCQNTSFRYNPNMNTTTHADEEEFSGILAIFVHHARNIHNICIYDNQDVYAKFSLTYNPDEALSTRIVNGGGKNPTFNENLRMKITQIDAVLKCEVWMFSRSRIHMEDQLLGFALVPISQVVGKGKVTEDYSLSSTDLFHSPAGTVLLSLSLDPSLAINSSVNLIPESAKNSSITSEVILLDRKISEVMLDPVEYARIEFPDISVVKENQQMVSEYFNSASHGTTSTPSSSRSNIGRLLPFLHLGASPQLDDYEMAMSSPHANHVESISPNESIQNSCFLGSTITTLSDDRNSADSVEKKNNLSNGDSSNSVTVSVTVEGAQNCGAFPDTPTSKKEGEARDEKEGNFSSIENESKKSNKNIEAAKFGQVFSAPLGNINLEAEQAAMQKQIVDMYMRSMQQFTESLAKMKLPMDLDKPEKVDHVNGDVIQNPDNNNKKLEIDQKKKDGSRVFYGSRAFF
ncbi:hypothetical protein Fmac_030744 [Flemingia macrophylla]|uniref:C2 domain-containing protein n=1 Tax=Flemingia macrophylla TaxID=520843 RepID=A0ABD1L0I0_9FABA